MEQFQFLRDKALEKIKVADHMLFMTYPIVKDPKLLIAVVENVFAGLDYAMAAILHHDRTFKKIPGFQDTYASRLEMFKSQVVPQRSMNPNYVRLVTDVRQLLAANKQSPVTFAKQGKFVMLSPKYDVKTIDVNLVKKYVFQAKIFVNNINTIVSKNERIFV